MKQVMDVWAGLTARKRLVVGLASLVMFAAVLGLVRIAATPNLSLLYAGLEPQAAGEIVQSLDQQGVAYDVRGGAIYVDSKERDGLRLRLASEGMPTTSAQGYELLDSLTGFGTTSQMFDAAYWRAKEGELARTILATPTISAARVHLANKLDKPFQRDARQTASVTVTTTNGGLSAAQAQAIRHLVASAIASMQPDDVAIIDSVSGLITSADASPKALPGIELGEQMRERILRLLEARVGQGNAMVEVNVTTDLESESIRERRVDPASRVAISSETEEASTESSGAPPGDVTVASNLPDGDAAGGGNSKSANSQTRERINYEVSETSREVIRTPGTVKRMTIAVLVNAATNVDQDTGVDGQTRTEEELNALKDLVASVAGFDETRGDIITIKSMEFVQPTAIGTTGQNSFFNLAALDLMSIIQLLVLSVVTLITGLFVLRPILMSAAKNNESMADSQSADQQFGGRLPALQTEPALTGEITDGLFDFGDMSMAFNTQSETAGPEMIDPMERLKGLISQRQNETVEILRGWLEDRNARVR